jgi:hypothetical protein
MNRATDDVLPSLLFPLFRYQKREVGIMSSHSSLEATPQSCKEQEIFRPRRENRYSAQIFENGKS